MRVAPRVIGGLAVPLLVIVLAGCAARLETPRIDFPPRDVGSVKSAILKALDHRRWLADDKAPGVIIGTLNIRTHQAVIEIDYNDSAYSIRYLDSTNLGYRRRWGHAEIHQNYNLWIAYLVKDIEWYLGLKTPPSR